MGGKAGRDGQTLATGQIVTGRVDRLFPFGAFVQLTDGSEAYIRRRELTQEGDLDPRQAVEIGQEIRAKVIALADRAHVLELSIRQAEPDAWREVERSLVVGDTVCASVKTLAARGAWVQVLPGVDGFVPLSELAPWPVEQPGDLLWVGDQVEAVITRLQPQEKRLQLSIRRQMTHMARVQAIASRLQKEEVVPEVEPGSEPLGDRLDDGLAEQDLRDLGRILVLDDDKAVRDGLVAWLEHHGCQAAGLGELTEALAEVQRSPYRVAIVDLDLGGQDGLTFIEHVRRLGLGVAVIVMSIPEWIAERSQDLEALGVSEAFAKPLQMDEVLDTLEQLARGEEIGPYRVLDRAQPEEDQDAFQRLGRRLRSSLPLEDRLESALSAVVQSTGARLAVLFHQDPASKRVSIAAHRGDLALNLKAVYLLAASPVKDLIEEGGTILQARLFLRERRRFQNLLEVVRFQSCLGIPVSAAGRVEHALFLFHSQPEAFGPTEMREAWAVSMLLGATLESRALEERLQTVNPLLLSGQLAAGFGHDVFNKMSALELQVRNLRAACGSLLDGDSASGSVGAEAQRQLGEEMDQLLDTTFDLKRTVEAFRELIRADDQGLVDVNQVVQRAAALLQVLARRQRVRIVLDLASSLPRVVGAPVRLQQVFLNVMLNAIQHTGAKLEQWPDGWGRLKVSTGLGPQLQAGGGQADSRVWVRLADSGPGIHRRLWEQIFALGVSTRGGGTGMGLFIARGLVESMGGAICVEQSLVPSGTVFRVELPVGSEGMQEASADG